MFIYLIHSELLVELTHYLLELPEVSGHCLLSERFSQVENYFGRQRAAGGYTKKPSVQQCTVSMGSRKLCIKSSTGNVQQKQ